MWELLVVVGSHNKLDAVFNADNMQESSKKIRNNKINPNIRRKAMNLLNDNK